MQFKKKKELIIDFELYEDDLCLSHERGFKSGSINLITFLIESDLQNKEIYIEAFEDYCLKNELSYSDIINRKYKG